MERFLRGLAKAGAFRAASATLAGMKRFDSTRDASALRELMGTGSQDYFDSWLRFGDLASDWAERTDLFSAPRPAAAIDVLFLDAVHVLRAGFIPQSARAVDIGAGVGAPAIPLALALPQTRWKLVEPRRRRVVFLRTAVGALGLRDRVVVEEGRLEKGKGGLGDFDVAVSRATFALDEWVTLGADLAPTVIGFVGKHGIPEDAGLPEASSKVHYETLDRSASRAALCYRP